MRRERLGNFPSFGQRLLRNICKVCFAEATNSPPQPTQPPTASSATRCCRRSTGCGRCAPPGGRSGRSGSGHPVWDATREAFFGGSARCGVCETFVMTTASRSEVRPCNACLRHGLWRRLSKALGASPRGRVRRSQRLPVQSSRVCFQ